MTIRWAEWGDEAFARGRESDTPILLSLTARWCHACHRMDEETWDDPAVAAAVERATVPVRVDADARPDLYGRYHLGGLPTTALLAPDGRFVRGGTFLSPTQLFAFLDIAIGDFKAGRVPVARAPTTAAPTGNLEGAVIARLLRRVDHDHGGFGAAPKQPETHALLLLLRRWRALRDSALEDVVRRALDAIIAHLTDARDGGFFRYAAAADWSGPHTEKLALDQAQLALLLLEAGAALGESRYLEAARQALRHARRRLAADDGRVFASVAADPEYYASAETDDPPAVDRRRFADSAAAMVFAALVAFALTGETYGFQSEFRSAAPDGRVPHRLDDQDRIGGLLRDQALAIEATLLEYRLTGEAALLQWGERAAEWSIRNLWDESEGAFRAARAPAAEHVSLPPMFPLIANGEMGLALADLAAHAGRMDYRRHAERLMVRLGGPALVSPAGAAVALVAQRLEVAPAEAEIHGGSGDARARELARAVVGVLGSATIVRWEGGDEPSATVCARDLCLPPIRDARELCRTLIDVGLARGGILDLFRHLTT
jgi:uncharacterized protein YyaL (SSP411 family)